MSLSVINRLERGIPGLKIPINTDAAGIVARAMDVRLESLTSRFAEVDIDRYTEFKNNYYNDFAGFTLDCIKWRDKERGPTLYQLKILNDILKNKRMAIRSLHGAGKTTLLAWLILAFALTRDDTDWKIVTTASAWRQLEKYLWPEIHKWARRLNWEVIGRSPFNKNELLTQSLKLKTGTAFAVASNNPGLLEGAHAEDNFLYVFDEAKIVPDEIFDAAEGAFSGTGEHYAIAVSTPGEPLGRFYDICTRKPGYEDWTAERITLEDVISANRTTRKWADQRKLQWGEKSAVYQNRVLGEFASNSKYSIIPLSFVERANDLHADWLESINNELPTPKYLGVDVGISVDKTVFAYAVPGKIIKIEELTDCNVDNATMKISGRVKIALDKYPDCIAIIDVIGIGAGVVHRLVEMGYKSRVIGFNAGSGTDIKDRLNEFRFKNKRAATWWMMKESLHPDLGDDILLPADDELLGELTTVRKKRETSDNKIMIEEKAEIKKRLHGRSTDKADAVLMALFGWQLYSYDGFKPIDLNKLAAERAQEKQRD